MSQPYELLQNPEFDLGTAIFLAEASQAAYAEEVDPAAWAQDQGFTTFKSFDRSNVQGFWCQAGDVALVSFRGTSNTGQWLRDARFRPSRHQWGWIHAGFKDGINDIEQDLALFDPVAAGAEHVWITGHSLGGALALVAAARFKARGISARLHTYGQPRVGFSGFADRFAIELPGALHRFVNQSDIVTRVPPGLFYTHTGIVKRIVRPGVLRTEQEAAAGIHGLEGAELQALRAATGSAALESAMAVEDSGITSPVLIESELPALSEEQFASLQLALTSGSTATEGVPGLESAAIEGALPFISDHSIVEYIRLLMEIRG